MTTFQPVHVSCPDIAVEVDFTNDPTNPTRVWTDITPYVRQLSYSRGGRNHELQRTEAGQLEAVLDNRDGRFDRTNTSSPYYPGVKRTRWVRVLGRWSGVTYPRWTGVAESWEQNWPAGGRDSICALAASDTFKVLNLFDLAGLSYSSELTGARVDNVLASASVAAGTTDAGNSTVVASGTFPVGSMALPHLLDVEQTENGLLFADADGSIVFQDRRWRSLNATTSSGTIGDLPGEIPYRTGSLTDDDADLWNTVSVTPSGGTPETVTDTTSVNAHYARKLSVSILSSSQSEALSAAGFLKTRYADAAPRIPSVSLVGRTDTSKWPTILAASNSKRYVWRRRVQNGTRLIEVDVHLEQVSESVIPGTDWLVEWALSPADTTTYWLAGDAVLSLAGETTRAGY